MAIATVGQTACILEAEDDSALLMDFWKVENSLWELGIDWNVLVHTLRWYVLKSCLSLLPEMMQKKTL